MAFLAGFAQLFKVNFLITLLIDRIYLHTHRSTKNPPRSCPVNCFCFLDHLLCSWHFSYPAPPAIAEAVTATRHIHSHSLLLSGLRAGLLTFGGAYTAIPFIQHDAVEVGRWLTNAQFLDGLALSGLLPAPLIIFSTFVGYIGGGPLGAIVLTVESSRLPLPLPSLDMNISKS